MVKIQKDVTGGLLMKAKEVSETFTFLKLFGICFTENFIKGAGIFYKA